MEGVKAVDANRMTTENANKRGELLKCRGEVLGMVSEKVDSGTGYSIEYQVPLEVCVTELLGALNQSLDGFAIKWYRRMGFIFISVDWSLQEVQP